MTCTLTIVNNSGGQLDAISMWCTPNIPPVTGELTPESAIFNDYTMAAGETQSWTVPDGSDTFDWWSGGVLFHGDGTTYLICGETGDPYKEFQVNDGTTVTFTIPPYKTDSTNQGDIAITYSLGGGDTAYLLNPDLVAVEAIANDILDAMDGD